MEEFHRDMPLLPDRRCVDLVLRCISHSQAPTCCSENVKIAEFLCVEANRAPMTTASLPLIVTVWSSLVCPLKARKIGIYDGVQFTLKTTSNG